MSRVIQAPLVREGLKEIQDRQALMELKDPQVLMDNKVQLAQEV